MSSGTVSSPVLSEPTPLIEGDPEENMKHTCGYAGLLSLGPDRSMIAYSDFQHMGSAIQHKAIQVRQVKVK